MDKYSDEMSLADWTTAIVDLKKLINPLAIDFTGGEPTIHPDFLEIVEFCRAHGVDWFMTTNGSALTRHRFVQHLVASRPIKIDISVDSASDDIHDVVRGVPGSLGRIEHGLRMLVSERNKTRLDFPVRIKVTVHRMNAGRLAPIVEWARRAGATAVDFNPVGGLWRKEQMERLAIREPRDIEILQEEVQKLIEQKSRGAPIETSTASLLSMIEHFSGGLTYGAAPCRDPVRNFIVNPRGDVRGCGCSSAFGNVRKQTAKQIWAGEVAKAARIKSLGCSLQVAVSSGKSSCMARKSIGDDIRRAMLLMGFGARRVQ
ncbi:radical SAM protein [Bradyrhizobium sp. WYCCWR 13023]|uniref:Radical SAM protein n=2 Tax=Nitrobacteraceae TaxID=41294 RepID=A0A9X1UCB5_9BRAD|nr:radical SAM protein [Bradyrhizobium zhengyangense]